MLYAHLHSLRTLTGHATIILVVSSAFLTSRTQKSKMAVLSSSNITAFVSIYVSFTR